MPLFFAPRNLTLSWTWLSGIALKDKRFGWTHFRSCVHFFVANIYEKVAFLLRIHSPLKFIYPKGEKWIRRCAFTLIRWNAGIKGDKLIRKEATITHHTISPLPSPPPPHKRFQNSKSHSTNKRWGTRQWNRSRVEIVIIITSLS